MRRTNTGGNERNLVTAGSDDHDYATLALPRELKEFLTEVDVGGYIATDILPIYLQWGLEVTKYAILFDRNERTLRTYGPKHPNYDPNIRLKDPRRK